MTDAEWMMWTEARIDEAAELCGSDGQFPGEEAMRAMFVELMARGYDAGVTETQRAYESGELCWCGEPGSTITLRVAGKIIGKARSGHAPHGVAPKLRSKGWSR